MANFPVKFEPGWTIAQEKFTKQGSSGAMWGIGKRFGNMQEMNSACKATTLLGITRLWAWEWGTTCRQSVGRGPQTELLGIVHQVSVQRIFEQAWRGNDKSETLKEFGNLLEFEIAVATLGGAIHRVMPWNYGFKTVAFFLTTMDFGHVRFRFENSCLSIERDRIASKKIFVLSNGFASYWK